MPANALPSPKNAKVSTQPAQAASSTAIAEA
jgi:hypothetical protein